MGKKKGKRIAASLSESLLTSSYVPPSFLSLCSIKFIYPKFLHDQEEYKIILNRLENGALFTMHIVSLSHPPLLSRHNPCSRKARGEGAPEATPAATLLFLCSNSNLYDKTPASSSAWPFRSGWCRPPSRHRCRHHRTIGPTARPGCPVLSPHGWQKLAAFWQRKRPKLTYNQQLKHFWQF